MLLHCVPTLVSSLQTQFDMSIFKTTLKAKSSPIDKHILIGTLEFQISLLRESIESQSQDMEYQKFRMISIIHVCWLLSDIYTQQSITRPKGRAPKGHIWDANLGKWVKNNGLPRPLPSSTPVPVTPGAVAAQVPQVAEPTTPCVTPAAGTEPPPKKLKPYTQTEIDVLNMFFSQPSGF